MTRATNIDDWNVGIFRAGRTDCVATLTNRATSGDGRRRLKVLELRGRVQHALPELFERGLCNNTMGTTSNTHKKTDFWLKLQTCTERRKPIVSRHARSVLEINNSQKAAKRAQHEAAGGSGCEGTMDGSAFI
jgi:uncharacterized protein YaeQ